MQKTLAFIALMACSPFSFAQITITASSFPTSGDTLRYAMDNNPLAALNAVLTPPGGAQNWDLSQVKIGNRTAIIFQAASKGSKLGSFAGADLVNLGATNETYYNVTATRFENLGFFGADPFGFNLNILLKWQPSLPERRAPMNFFDINQVSSNFNLALSIKELPDVIKNNIPGVNTGIVDSIRIRLAVQRLDVVDGWGNLKLPNATYPVLREKRTEYRRTAVDAHTFLGWIEIPLNSNNIPGLPDLVLNDTTTSYHYFSNQSKEVVAQITLTKDLSSIKNIRFKAPRQTSVGTHEISSPAAGLQLVPNPANEWIKLSFEPRISGKVNVLICDGLGRTLHQEYMQISQGIKTELQIPTQALPNGIYTLVLQAGEKLEAQRFVLQH